jgi:hypothetical protein
MNFQLVGLIKLPQVMIKCESPSNNSYREGVFNYAFIKRKEPDKKNIITNGNMKIL